MQIAETTERLKALDKLLLFPSRPILDGPTAITPIINTPLKVAQTERLKLSVSIKNPIFLKRDDLTPGFGNKTRKLEVILADAVAAKADCIITAGGRNRITVGKPPNSRPN